MKTKYPLKAQEHSQFRKGYSTRDLPPSIVVDPAVVLPTAEYEELAAAWHKLQNGARVHWTGSAGCFRTISNATLILDSESQ